MKLTGFNGYPDGELDLVQVPHLFFTDLLPKIDDLAELKLTLYFFHLLQPPQGQCQWIWGDQLRQDMVLLRLMGDVSALHEPSVLLEQALERAVARNTVLRLALDRTETDAGREAFALNSESGRRVRQEAQTGRLAGAPASRVTAAADQSLPFRLYQQNIGLLTPFIAENLRDLEREYPVDWVCEAIEIAASKNARALRYIEKILERWAVEGREHG